MFRVSQLPSLFRCIRWGDVAVLEGVPILGVVLSAGGAATAESTKLVLFGFASFLLLAHVFTLNDWADFTRGVHHSSRAMLQLEQRNIGPRQLLMFSFLLLVASTALFVFLSWRCLFLAAAVALLGIFYSHPSLNAKSMPVISTALHFLGGTLDFLLGYALFLPVDLRGVLIGLFFGIAFAAGHPIQEVRDLQEDRRAGARTNAIVFGPKASFLAGIVLFSVQYVYLFALAWCALLPRPLAILPVIFYPMQLVWSGQTIRNGLTSENIVRLQSRYRIIYAFIGFGMLLAVLSWSGRSR